MLKATLDEPIISQVPVQYIDRKPGKEIEMPEWRVAIDEVRQLVG